MVMLAQDIKYAFRQLQKTPGFTAVAMLSLALGIGANTAIFSVLNAVWMRALPVRDPHALRVVKWSGHNTRFSHWSGGGDEAASNRSGITVTGSFPYPVYRDFKERVEGCSDVFAFFGMSGLTVVGPQGATTADALMVSGDFFDGYGAQAFMGRTLQAGDESSQADSVAVITYHFWEKQCNLDPGVIGRMITINGHPFTIVGVMPRTYCGPQIGDTAQIYVPMSAQPALSPRYHVDARDHWWAKIMVRVKPKADESQIKAVMEGLLLQTFSTPGQGMQTDDPHILLGDGSRGLLGIRRQIASGLVILMLAVSLVLMIACANLAGLLLARGAARQQELAVRAAMGAGRRRLIRQLLTESLVLSLAGAGLGLLVAIWIKAIMLGFVPDILADSFRLSVRIDARVLLFTLGAAVATSLLSGLLPALRVTRLDLCSGLKGQRALGISGLRLGKMLVAAQVSLSVLLVMSAGLLLQTLINLYRTDLGFSTDRILVFGLNPGQAGYEGADAVRFYDQVEANIAALPGVKHVALSSNSLLGERISGGSVSIPGRTRQKDQGRMVRMLDVSETFFQTMDIPLLRGRAFERTDTSAQPGVVVANVTFVRTFFPHEDPLGQSIRTGDKEYQIVGLCADAKYERVRSEIGPTLYFSHRQARPGAMVFEVRTASDPLTLVPAVRKTVADLERMIPLEQVSTQLQLFRTSVTPEQIFTSLCGGLALLGISLSCIGLYGLLAFVVTRRTGEIGVRLALGARPRDIAWPVMRSALWLTALGLLVGIPVALGLTRVLRSVLFGVTPHDPITIFASVLLIFAIAALAAWLPARRAARIDPMTALRYE